MKSNVINFNEAANVAIRRSHFKTPSRHLTTFNAGELIPIYLQEVLPGDTFKMDSALLIRQTTSIHPTMDNAYVDTFFFFVPSRLVWDDWQHMNGESDTAWAQDQEYSVPNIVIKSGTKVAPGSILDHFGVFPNDGQNLTYDFKINAMPIRAYFKIWNDWFRDENLQDAIDLYTLGVDEVASNVSGINCISPSGVLSANKYHDYFTSALPKPQKGADVLIPAAGAGAVKAMPLYNTLFANPVIPYFSTPVTSGEAPARWDPMNPATIIPGDDPTDGQTLNTYQNVAFKISNEDDTPDTFVYNPGSSLYADLKSVEITVNNLRLAVQTQKLLEKDARGGTRYTELLRSHFGVTSPDARLQRSEYLGGKHVPINMAEIAQTSASSGSSYLGDLAGYSATADSGHDFTKSFVEHGFVIGLAVVRTARSYGQGIEKIWFKEHRLDFYWPVLANIGEQPIYKRELYAGFAAATDVAVFGYQEAWAEYRYKPNSVSGYFRPQISGTLDSWTYTDDYGQEPVLGDAWIKQSYVEVDRTLVVKKASAPQYTADFAFFLDCYRCMPLNSIPGYMDHF